MMASHNGALASQSSLQLDRLPSVRTLSRFLGEAQAAIRLRGLVTVLLTTDVAMRRLNRQFRGKNKSTDVLSFPAGGPAAGEVAGDLAISVPTALRQAREQGHRLLIEIKVLILHGLLHLAGYDHESDDGQMARRERLLRGKLKLPQGLIERAGSPPQSENPDKKKPRAVRATPARRVTKRTAKGTPAKPRRRGLRP
jgi:probable rRNA maturation factor